jgi:lysophospholipase L1-like esterase
MKVRSVPLLLTALLGAAVVVVAAAPAQAATTINYVALGDSYSAGVGAGGYDTSSGSCSRSPRSYAPLWATSHAVTSFTFAACSGATTDDVRNNQLGGLGGGTTLVTITIGGNDAGFVNVVTTCVLGTDGSCQWMVDGAKWYATNVLPGKLDQTYAAIRSRAPNARLVVLGYPRLFELTTWCNVFGLDLAKRTMMNGAADTLASVIAGRAQAAGATFVDVRGAFAGHRICSSDTWINPTTWPVSDSYHPTASGYRYAYLPSLAGVTG